MTEEQEMLFEKLTDHINSGYEIYKDIVCQEESGKDFVEAMDIMMRNLSEDKQIQFKAGIVGEILGKLANF